MHKYLREPPVPPLMRSWVGNMLGLTLEVMVHARQFPSSSSRELLIPGAWHPPARASTWWAHPAEQFIRLTSASTAQSILVPAFTPLHVHTIFLTSLRTVHTMGPLLSRVLLYSVQYSSRQNDSHKPRWINVCENILASFPPARDLPLFANWTKFI